MGLKINANYFLNILGSATQTWHPIQIQSGSGGGQRIQNNMIEEDPAVAPYTHDQISVYQSNGIVGDSIMVTGNWIRGGQQIQNGTGPGGGTGSTNGAAAIGVGDSGGSLQVVRNNLMINALAIAIDGSGTSLKVDHNKSYMRQISPQPNSIGIVYFGSAGNNVVRNNLLNCKNSSGTIVNLNPATSATISGWSTNTNNSSLDAGATVTMIPTPMVAACGGAPVFHYSPNVNTYSQGTAIGTLAPVAGGGVASSYSVSPSFPSGISLNTSTGVISGTPTTTSSSTLYIVTGTNSFGSDTARVTMTVNSSIVAPSISYSPTSNTYTVGTTITTWTPSNSGGAVVGGYSISSALPAGLSFSTSTGAITGTPTVAHSVTTYTITASNTAGSSTPTITITVNNPAPLVVIKRVIILI